MSVEVKDIKEDHFPFDACCFCRASTTLRYHRIPCCKFCASRARPEDMPTLEQYNRREKIAYCNSVRQDE